MLILKYINLFLFMVAMGGYFYPDRLTIALGVLSWPVLYPILYLVYKIDPLSSALSILVFNCLQVTFAGYKAIIRQDRRRWVTKFDEKEMVREKLLAKSKELIARENEIGAREVTTVNLYEITKEMSQGLKFDDIFNVFSSFIKENFRFKRCDLLILDEEANRPAISREYTVWQSAEKDAPASEVERDRVLELLEGSRQAYIVPDKRNEGLVAAIPLMSEKKMVAVLIAEGLHRDELKEFTILAMQFALEIKKVLLYETVEKLAITDSLTGLYVRRYFLVRLDEELKRSRTYNFRFAFLMIDIDNFKRYNDTYGHLVGDVILKDMARIMKANVREIDLVSRYGGEEFAMVLPETAEDGAKVAAERIRKTIAENVFKAYDETLKVTVSIGFCIYPDADSQAAIIERADEALYRAKKSGKNIVCEYKK